MGGEEVAGMGGIETVEVGTAFALLGVAVADFAFVAAGDADNTDNAMDRTRGVVATDKIILGSGHESEGKHTEVDEAFVASEQWDIIAGIGIWSSGLGEEDKVGIKSLDCIVHTVKGIVAIHTFAHIVLGSLEMRKEGVPSGIDCGRSESCSLYGGKS